MSVLLAQKEMLDGVLGQKSCSVRQHYLAFNPSVTPSLQSEAGFSYDTTFGFNKFVGFRAGTSYPFKLNDMLEIPLIIQDGALLKSNNFHLPVKQAIELAKLLIDNVKNVGGVVSLLWHPNVNTSKSDEWFQVFEEVVKYCDEENGWFGTISDIGQHWEALDRKIFSFEELSLISQRALSSKYPL